MSDDYDDLDSPEEDQTPEVPEAVTLRDLKKARNEAENLRTRLKEAQDQVLTTRFKDDVLSLIPEEVTDFDRRVALAEQYAARFGASETQPQTDQAPADAPSEEPTPEEKALAAVGTGPSGAGSPGPVDQKELLDRALADPVWYAAQREKGLRLEGLPGN